MASLLSQPHESSKLIITWRHSSRPLRWRPTRQVYHPASSPAWVVFRNWHLFREPDSANIWYALVLIVSGVILSTRSWAGRAVS